MVGGNCDSSVIWTKLKEINSWATEIRFHSYSYKFHACCTYVACICDVLYYCLLFKHIRTPKSQANVGRIERGKMNSDLRFCCLLLLIMHFVSMVGTKFSNILTMLSLWLYDWCLRKKFMSSTHINITHIFQKKLWETPINITHIFQKKLWGWFEIKHAMH